MKRTALILLLAICLAGGFVAILVKSNSTGKDKRTASHFADDNIVEIEKILPTNPANTANDKTSNAFGFAPDKKEMHATGYMGQDDKTITTNRLFEVVTDPQSGKHASVSLDGVVTLRSRDESVVWSTNVARIVGTSRIHSVKVSARHIVIVLSRGPNSTRWGNMRIYVNKESGAVGFGVD